MEAARKGHEHNRVNKPARNPIQSQEEDLAAQKQPSMVPGSTVSRLPSGPGTKLLRQAAVLRMQRTLGNQAVARQIRTGIQRQEETEGAGGGTGGNGPTGAGPSEISSGSSSVTTSASGVNIEGAMVTVGSPILQTDGIVQASTIIADSVVASSYTPGAGNIW